MKKNRLKASSNQNQKNKVRNYLKTHIATASMVEEATGVHHKNICRHKAALQKEGVLFEVNRKLCLRTNHLATYLVCV